VLLDDAPSIMYGGSCVVTPIPWPLRWMNCPGAPVDLLARDSRDAQPGADDGEADLLMPELSQAFGSVGRDIRLSSTGPVDDAEPRRTFGRFGVGPPLDAWTSAPRVPRPS
jgi:hypothetical protein